MGGLGNVCRGDTAPGSAKGCSVVVFEVPRDASLCEFRDAFLEAAAAVQHLVGCEVMFSTRTSVDLDDDAALSKHLATSSNVKCCYETYGNLMAVVCSC